MRIVVFFNWLSVKGSNSLGVRSTKEYERLTKSTNVNPSEFSLAFSAILREKVLLFAFV